MFLYESRHAPGDGASFFFNTPSSGNQVDVSFMVEAVNNDVLVEVIPQSGTPYNFTVPAGNNLPIFHGFNSFGTNCEIRVTSTGFSALTYPDNIYIYQVEAIEQVPVTSNIIYVSQAEVTLTTTTITEVCDTLQVDRYRYGFNGQEKDNEVSGTGNSLTAEFWQYDPRLGRRYNIDPVIKPWESGYAVMGNNPIWNRDPNGDDFINVHTERKEEAKIDRDEAATNLGAAETAFKPFEEISRNGSYA